MIVPVTVRRNVFEAFVIKTKSSRGVKEADLPLSEMTDTEWLQVIYSALAK